MSNSQPFRFREEQFRRYEDHIRRAVECFPKPYIVNPAPLASTTFTCRCRDAITSLLKNIWRTSVDVRKLSEIRHKFVIKEVAEGLVQLGPAESTKSIGEQLDLSAPTATLQIVTNPSDEVLQAYAVLIHNKAWVGTVKFVQCHPLVAASLMELENKYNIGISQEDDSSFIML